MGWFWFLLLLVVVAGGIYLYQKLLAIEQEIRQEHSLSSPAREDKADEEEESPALLAPIIEEPTRVTPDKGSDTAAPVSLEESLLTVVNDLPGLLQTELYGLFPGEERKRLQGMLLRLDRQGLIRREKKKSSYRVFPA